MYFDYHVHSEFSDDSTYKMEDVIDDAIALGIEELCFTDHVDYGVKDDHDTFPRKHNRGTIEILKVIIADGKGIELNTSSTRYGIDDTMPSRDILRLYKALGGKIITLGSDSHKKEHLGTYIEEGMRILKDMGYEKIYTFDRMVPIAHKL